ncbi:MAG: hypothetical protein VX000_17780 [Myxococcota bacterium]|nr:hypothetical protein [Myxococcota bacterium]
MTRRLLPFLAALPVLAIACGEEDDAMEDTGSGRADSDCFPYCEETHTGIAPTDDTALGVVGGAAIEPLPASAEAEIRWVDGTQSVLSWGVAVGIETLRVVEADAVYPTCEGGVPSIAVDCPDAIAVEGTLSLSAADGMLDAAVPVTFSLYDHAVAEGTLSFSAQLEASELGSGFTLSDHVDTAAYDDVSLSLSGTVSSEGALALTLLAQGTGEDGSVAWADRIDIATVGGGAL